MDRRHLLSSGIAGLSAVALTGCFGAPSNGFTIADFPGRQDAVVRLWDRFRAKGLRFGAPVHLVAYKQERVMELWVEGADGRYQLFSTYKICAYSGTLGPKLREGDLQTPEGFYEVRASMLNPWSDFHLGINLGFPNSYDRSRGRTGSFLAIHGDCASIGCYAMGDKGIEEIYLAAEQSFLQGAARTTLAAYPFRPSAANLAAIQGHHWEGFWRNIFQSELYFQQIGRPPTFRVVNRQYQFYS